MPERRTESREGWIWKRPVCVRDVHGRRIPLIATSALIGRGVDEATLRRATRESVDARGWTMLWFQCAANSLALLFTIPMCILAPSTGSLRGALSLQILLPFGMAALQLYLILSLWPACRRTWASLIAAGIVRANHCPGCGYNLLTLPEDSLGRSTCPECGGTWQTGTSPASPTLPGASSYEYIEPFMTRNWMYRLGRWVRERWS